MPLVILKKSFPNFLFIFLTSFLLCLLLSGQSFAKQLKIDVYRNKPLVFQDEQGRFQELSIDVLRTIAEAEGWDLEFIPGSWPECLQRLDKAETDL